MPDAYARCQMPDAYAHAHAMGQAGWPMPRPMCGGRGASVRGAGGFKTSVPAATRPDRTKDQIAIHQGRIAVLQGSIYCLMINIYIYIHICNKYIYIYTYIYMYIYIYHMYTQTYLLFVIRSAYYQSTSFFLSFTFL